MFKNLFKNSIILFLILLTSSILISFIGKFILNIDDITFEKVSLLMVTIIGFIYRYIYEEKMPKSLRFKVSLYFSIFYLISYYFFFHIQTDNSTDLLKGPFLDYLNVFVAVICFIFNYFIMGKTSSIDFKNLIEKSKQIATERSKNPELFKQSKFIANVIFTIIIISGVGALYAYINHNDELQFVFAALILIVILGSNFLLKNNKL